MNCNLTIAEEFCKIFYSRMSTNIPSIYNLYSPSAMCIVNNINKHIMTCGVLTFEYHNLTRNVVSIDQNNLIITVAGMLRMCYSHNSYSQWTNFGEIFILTNNNNIYTINTHVLNTI